MDPKHLSTIATVLGILGAFAAAAGGWYVLQHRVAALEAQTVEQKAIIKTLRDEVNEAPHRVECLIREVHKLDRFGCAL